MSCKVGVAVEDRRVAARFGSATRFEVVTVEDGRVTHRGFRLDPGAGEDPTFCHGRRIARLLADCDVVVAGEMGPGISAHLEANGVRPAVTSERSPEAAALQAAAGPPAGR